MLNYQLAQLAQLGEQNGELKDAVETIRMQLEGDKPWSDITSIDPALQTVREAYVAERQQVLASLGDLAESVRARVKARKGFSTLTADQSHHVLRPVTEALPNTSEEKKELFWMLFPGLIAFFNLAAEARDCVLRAGQ